MEPMGEGNGAGQLQRKMAIGAVRDGLAELHRALIEAARLQHERKSGEPVGAGELLQLLTQSSEFAWLHPVSELIADLDALQGEPASTELAAAVRRALQELLFAPAAGEPSPFWTRYAVMLQEQPRVAMAHGQLRQLLVALPEPAAGGETLHQRHEAALLRKRRR